MINCFRVVCTISVIVLLISVIALIISTTKYYTVFSPTFCLHDIFLIGTSLLLPFLPLLRQRQIVKDAERCYQYSWQLFWNVSTFKI